MPTIKLTDVQWRDDVPEDARPDAVDLTVSDMPYWMFVDEFYGRLASRLADLLGMEYAEGIKSCKVMFEFKDDEEMKR